MLTRGLSDGQIQLFKEMAAQMLCNLDDWEGETCAYVTSKQLEAMNTKNMAFPEKEQ